MPSSPDFALAVTELVYYSPTVLPMCYCIWTHRRRGLLGWTFLLVFIILQLTGSGLAVSAGPHGHPSITAAIIAGVGISPLLLGAAGLLHELMDITGSTQTLHLQKKSWMAAILYHFIVVTGVVLYALGRNNSVSIPPKTGGKVLGEVGIVILLVAWAMLVGVCGMIWRMADCRSCKPLFRATMISIGLLGVRLVYSCVATFSTAHVFRAAGGSIALRVLFEFLVGAMIVAVIITGGVMTHYVEDGDDDEK